MPLLEKALRRDATHREAVIHSITGRDRIDQETPWKKVFGSAAGYERAELDTKVEIAMAGLDRTGHDSYDGPVA